MKVIFLFSKTTANLVSSLTVEPVEEKSEGVLGRRTLVVEETWFELQLHQEFPQRQLSQEMIVGRLNIIVLSFSSNQELRNQGQFLSSPLVWSCLTERNISVENQRGILHYIKNYWRGYFNLFLVSTQEGYTMEKSLKESLEKDFSNLFLYHSSDSLLNDEFFDVLTRFYIHNDKYQCNKTEKTTSTSSNQSLLSSWQCSGLCGLKTDPLSNVRKRKKSFINVIKRKISRT